MNPKRTLTCHSATLLLALAGCTRTYGDISIFWGGEAGATGYASDGVTPWDSSYIVELGWFDGGFQPTSTNFDLWSAAWKPVDLATWTISPTTYFSGTVVLTDNLTVPAGAAAYMWVRDSAAPGGGTEWLLVTNENWLFPDTSGSDQTTAPLFWDLIASADVHDVTFGGVADEADAIGGDWTPVPGGSYGYQTHSVPEPAGTIATALPTAFALLTATRRRRPTTQTRSA